MSLTLRRAWQLGALVSLVTPNAARAELPPVVAHPERAPRVFDRRWGEFAIHLGGAARDCYEACDEVESLGWAAGFTALLRPNRSFALLVGLERAWFSWQADGGEDLTAHVTFQRIGARLYLIDTSRLDGWLEVSLVRPTWGASQEVRVPYSGLGTGMGAGLDVFVWDYLKVGPYARVNWALVDRGPDSSGGSVGSAGQAPEAPAINLVLQLGLSVTVAFGPKVE